MGRITFFPSLSKALRELGERDVYVLLQTKHVLSPTEGEEEVVLLRKDSKGEVRLIPEKDSYYYKSYKMGHSSPMEGSGLRIISPLTIKSVIEEMVDRGLPRVLNPLWVEKLKESVEFLGGKDAIILDKVHRCKEERVKKTILKMLEGVDEKTAEIWEREVLLRNQKSPWRVEGLFNRYKEVIGKFKVLFPILPDISNLERIGIVHETMNKLVLWKNPEPKELKNLIRTLSRHSIRELLYIEGEVEVASKPIPEIVVVPYPTPKFTNTSLFGFSEVGEKPNYSEYYSEDLLVDSIYLAKLEIVSVNGENLVYFYLPEGGKSEEEAIDKNKQVKVYRSYIKEGDISVAGKREVVLKRIRPPQGVKISIFFNERDKCGNRSWRRGHVLDINLFIHLLIEPIINEDEEVLESRQVFLFYLVPSAPFEKKDFYQSPSSYSNYIEQVATHFQRCEKVEVREVLYNEEDDEVGLGGKIEMENKEHRNAWYISERLMGVINYSFMALIEGKDNFIKHREIALSTKSKGNLAVAYKGLLNSLVKPGLKEKLVFGFLDSSLCFKENKSGERCPIFPLIASEEKKELKEIEEHLVAQTGLYPLGEEVFKETISSVLTTPLSTLKDVEMISKVIGNEEREGISLFQLLEKISGKTETSEVLKKGFLLHIFEKSLEKEKENFTTKIEVDIYKEEERAVITKVVGPIKYTVNLKTKELEIMDFKWMLM